MVAFVFFLSLCDFSQEARIQSHLQREDFRVSLASQHWLCLYSILEYLHNPTFKHEIKGFGDLGNLLFTQDQLKNTALVFLGASVFMKLCLWVLQSQRNSSSSFIRGAQYSDVEVIDQIRRTR